jgi:hypothetical protein
MFKIGGKITHSLLHLGGKLSVFMLHLGGKMKNSCLHFKAFFGSKNINQKAQ